MSIFSRLFQRFEPEEQLVVDVVEELKRRGIVGSTYNHQAYSITVGPKTLGLRNLFLEWRLRDRREKAALVKRFLDSQLAGPINLAGIDAPVEKLLPVVRARYEICLGLPATHQ